jgi:HD-GYP domain-containing protein (c-di-GMP phosphodiesterase class II)
MKAEYHMYHNKLEESTQMRIETIKLITKTLFQKSSREKSHCERVSKLCELMGNALNMSEEAVKVKRRKGLLDPVDTSFLLNPFRNLIRSLKKKSVSEVFVF